MELRPRSGDEERFSSFDPAPPPPPPPPHPFSGNGYFSFQAMRAGFVDRPRNSLEALEMELREERLREEIIARRIAQRRMIEEQSRREMEIALAMGMGGGGGLLCHTQLMLEPPEEVEFGERRRFGPRLGRRSMPEGPEDIDFGRRAVERSRFRPLLGGRDVGADGRAPRGARELEVGKKLTSWSKKPEVKTTTTTETIAPKPAGTKRKPAADISGTSGSKFSRPAQKKVWSCALCQVSATSEEGLNEHLQGKKHLAKVGQLGSKKNFTITALDNSGTGSSSASGPNVATKKNPSAKVTRKVSIKVNEKVHEVVEKGRFLWCWMCRVKCNDQSSMIAHLSGKRHLLEDSKKPMAIDVATPQNKEVVEDNKKEMVCEDKNEFAEEAEQLGSAGVSEDMVVVKD